MIKIFILDFESSSKVLGHQFWEFALEEHVIVPVVHRSLLLLILERGRNEGSLLLGYEFSGLRTALNLVTVIVLSFCFGIPIISHFLFLLMLILSCLFALLFVFGISILQIPFDENILLLELLVLLLVGPHVNEGLAAHPEDPVKLLDRLYPQRIGREVVNHGDGNHPVHRICADGQGQGVGDERLVLGVFLFTNINQIKRSISSNRK